MSQGFQLLFDIESLINQRLQTVVFLYSCRLRAQLFNSLPHHLTPRRTFACKLLCELVLDAPAGSDAIVSKSCVQLDNRCASPCVVKRVTSRGNASAANERDGLGEVRTECPQGPESEGFERCARETTGFDFPGWKKVLMGVSTEGER